MNTRKTVRFEDEKEVDIISTQRLRRSKSLDTFFDAPGNSGLQHKPKSRKMLEYYSPGRRLSSGVFESIKEVLKEMEPSGTEENAEECARDGVIDEETRVPFEELDRDEKLKVLKDSKNKKKFYSGAEEGKERDWVGLKSLTGANASGWKFQDSFYGNFNVGRRPSMDTAWGRRIYDQYEIELDKPKKCSSKEEPNERRIFLRRESRELGIWDVIFNSGVIPSLERSKSWIANHEDRDKALKKLNIENPETIFQEEDPVVNEEDPKPLNDFKLKFSSTGEFLRQSDVNFCLSRTGFSREEVIDWFKRFRRDCPNGRLTKDNLRRLFRQTCSPRGNAEQFTFHIMRLFDTDGNEFLDFKEFLMALDITQNRSASSEEYYWAFKLYDIDKDGCLDIEELSSVIKTLDAINGVIPGSIEQDSHGNPEVVLSSDERARNLFDLLNKEYNSYMSLSEFISGYVRRSEMVDRQDAQEQVRKLSALIFCGRAFTESSFEREDLSGTLIQTLNKRLSADLVRSDFEILTRTSPNSIFSQFSSTEKRNHVYSLRRAGKKQGIIIQEWLTERRSYLFERCLELKRSGRIKDVSTKNGEIIAWIPCPTTNIQGGAESKKYEKRLVSREKDYEALLSRIREIEDEKSDVFMEQEND